MYQSDELSKLTKAPMPKAWKMHNDQNTWMTPERGAWPKHGASVNMRKSDACACIRRHQAFALIPVCG